MGVILLLAAPGVFRKQETYQLFVDNAAGLKPGASVLVAGHPIGNVARVDAPVPTAKRPAKYPNDEVGINRGGGRLPQRPPSSRQSAGSV